MPDALPDWHALRTGRIDETQGEVLRQVILALFDPDTLDVFLAENGLVGLYQYAGEGNFPKRVLDLKREMGAAPDKMRQLLSALLEHTNDYSDNDNLDRLRDALMIAPKLSEMIGPGTEQTDRGWAATAAIAERVSAVTFWADMVPQKVDILDVATRLVVGGAQGGVRPLVAVLKGRKCDDSEAFVNRLKYEFVASAETTLSQIGYAPQRSLSLGGERSVDQIALNRAGQGDAFARLDKLRKVFLNALDPIGWATVAAHGTPDDPRGAFINAFESLVRRGGTQDAIVLMVYAADFTRSDGELLDLWLDDWAEIAERVVLPRQFVHLIYFEDNAAATSPQATARPGLLARLFAGGRPQQSGFELACRKHLETIPPPLPCVQPRNALDWQDVAKWMELAPVVAAARVGEDQMRQFRNRMKFRFDAEDMTLDISMDDFHDTLMKISQSANGDG